MQPLKIRIDGRYWDSYLYNDNLLLLTREGDLEIYSWDRLLDAVATPSELRTPLRHLAARGRAWYALAVQELIHAGGVQNHLRSYVTALTSQTLRITRADLSRKVRRTTAVELFPSTDIEVFGNVLYMGSTDGLTASPLASIADLDVSRDSVVLDAPALKLAASYSHLAVAHGEDGLSEISIGRMSRYLREDDRAVFDHLISEENCDSCSWSYFDVIGSTSGEGGFIGAFSKPGPGGRASDYDDRQLLGTIPSHEVFGERGGLLTGSGNLLMLAREGELRTERWNPYRRREDYGIDRERTMVSAPKVTAVTNRPEPLDLSVTVFGAVLELDEQLVVFRSDGQTQIIKGEPVAWRAFPRSQRYLNHLHVVRDRWIDIYVFAHDYFVRDDTRANAMDRPSANSW